jgi:purine-nucleoside phosphorylase
MEASALFYLAARARAVGQDVRAACILTVSDMLGEGLSQEETYLPLEELQRATDRMVDVALAAGSRV